MEAVTPLVATHLAALDAVSLMASFAPMACDHTDRFVRLEFVSFGRLLDMFSISGTLASARTNILACIFAHSWCDTDTITDGDVIMTSHL